ncbi:MAG: restriction endonuclease [Tissierellia bacterium]|nr:restriction endonuclease [Tissierellia bacterium]
MMREDWVEVKLGDAFFTTSGGTPSRKVMEYFNGNIPWVKSGELNYNVIKNTEEHITEEAIKNSSAKVFPEETLLIALYGATIGKLAILGVPAATNQAVCGIYKNDNFLVKFIYYYLFHKKQKLVKQGIGGAQPNISQTILKRLLVPVVSHSEQRAIVAKIEELFSELDNGIESLKKAKEQLEVYRQAVLKAAFEGKLTKEWRERNSYSMVGYLSSIQQVKAEAIRDKLIPKSDYFPEFKEEELTYKCPENWIHLPFKTITKNNKYSLKRGPFGSSLKKEFFVEKGIPVYEQANAINDEPYYHRYFITEEKFNELKAFEVSGGDMIVSCSGTLGRISLLPNNAKTGVINQALLKVDIDEDILLKRYFILLFRSGTFQSLLFKKSIGTAMRNMVGMKQLKEIPIPIPSLEEQEQIIIEIESRLSVCENIEANIEEALEKAEGLRQSILKKAFEGKLLSKEELEACKLQDDWEPAAELLKRIKETKKEAKK